MRRNRLAPRTLRAVGIVLGVTIAASSGLASVALAAQAPPKPDAPKPKPRPKPAGEDLSKKLIRQAAGDADEDLMSEIIRLMDEASRKLARDLDAGTDTQATQAAVMAKLDEVIKRAAMNQRRPSQSTQQTRSDKRTMPKQPHDKRDRPSGDTRQDAAALPTGTVDAGKGKTDTDTAGASGAMGEWRRTWGNLPQRERDEVIQGRGEAFLERYRELIERYYRALQESQEKP